MLFRSAGDAPNAKCQEWCGEPGAPGLLLATASGLGSASAARPRGRASWSQTCIDRQCHSHGNVGERANFLAAGCPGRGHQVQGAPRRCAIGVLPTLDPVSAHRARSYEQDRIGAVTPCQTLVAVWTAAQQVLASEPGHEPQQQQAATTPGDPSDRF